MERPKLYWLIPLLLIIAGGLLLTRIRFDPVVNLRLQGAPTQSIRFVTQHTAPGCCCIIAPDGSLWFVGQDHEGILGTNSLCFRIPKRLEVDGVWRDIAFAGDQFVGVRNDGSLWGWDVNGLNVHRNALLPARRPGQLVEGTNWLKVVAGLNNFFVLREDGALFGMGGNRYATLGDGTEMPRSNLTAVAIEHRWRQLAVGAVSTAGIRRDGTLWAWGKDVSKTPTQVGAATNWIEIDAVGYVFVARNANGEVYAWGGNSNYVIDGGQASPLTSFVALPDSQRWSRVWPSETSLLARDIDGKFWCWGLGFPERRGFMGKHDPRQRRPMSMPTQISTICLVHDQLGMVLGYSEDGILWNRGEIIGAHCGPTVAEKRKANIVKWLSDVGIITPELTKWAEPFNYSTNFVPVARFSNP